MENKLNGNYNKRNYGIDALRICATIMVVTLHVLSQGGVLGGLQDLTRKGEFFWGVQAICFCSVNCFALISGYVGLNSKHRVSSLLSIWLQLFFYGVLFFGIDVIITKEISIRQLINVIFPIITRQNWYISAYWYAFFFMPLFNYLINHLPKTYLKKICLVLFFFFSIVEFVFENAVLGVQAGYSFIWISILYFLGAYIAKYDPFKNWKKRYCILSWGVCMLLTIIGRLGIQFIALKVFGGISYGTKPLSYISPLILLGSVFLLAFFVKLKVDGFAQKIIKFLSPMTLGVFLIHTSPIIYRKVLLNCLAPFTSETFFILLGIVVLSVLIIYVVCSLIDFLRILLFKCLRVSRVLTFVQSKIEKLVNKILKIDTKEDS